LWSWRALTLREYSLSIIFCTVSVTVSSQASNRTKHRSTIDAPVGDSLEKRIESLESALKFSELRCAKLQYTIDDLLRRLYGPKTDKIDPGQLALLTSEMDTDRAVAQAPQPLPTAAEPGSSVSSMPKRKGGGRHRAPGHLPIEIIRIDPPANELMGMRRIRDEITEEIEYRPSQYFRRHIIRGVFVRQNGEGAPIIAPLPPRVIPQAGVGPGLIAHTLVAKYVDHCPLYRIWTRTHIRYYESAKNMGTGFRFACDFLHPRVQIAA
jgi:transposase